MRVLDLFAGTGSATQPFRDRGHHVVEVEMDPAFAPDVCADISNLTASDLPGPWDFVWASPPCTSFSVASIGTHWSKRCGVFYPKTLAARASVALVEHTLRLIEGLRPLFWLVENPRGILRKLPVMSGLKRVTVTYCQYGDSRMKPTDLWGEWPSTILFRACANGAPCHESAPRGSKAGTQALETPTERAMVPYQLGLELCEAIEKATFFAEAT